VIAATGPFDLAPGGGQRVAFAMLAGTTRAEFLRELDSLQTWFDENVPVGLAGEPPTGPARASITVAPNPVRTRAHIAFTASGNCHTTLSLFDRAGRQVEHLWSGSPTNRPVTLTWSNPGLDPGVYFLRLESAGVARTVKTIIAR
ncbi:MAG: T9SS type A sorting domain-containing protein, partial [candidate division WOR-3 bacterium]